VSERLMISMVQSPKVSATALPYAARLDG
jgi:hypothetical protein